MEATAEESGHLLRILREDDSHHPLSPFCGGSQVVVGVQ
jgi:hypothetical protein